MVVLFYGKVGTNLQHPPIQKLFLVSADMWYGSQMSLWGFDQLIMYSFRSFNNLIYLYDIQVYKVSTNKGMIKFHLTYLWLSYK